MSEKYHEIYAVADAIFISKFCAIHRQYDPYLIPVRKYVYA